MRNIMFTVVLSVWLFIVTGSVASAIDQWPDTGQVGCYDSLGDVISCDGSVGPAGQDGFYSGPARSYDTTTKPGTVIDAVTMLQWYNPSVPQSAPTSYSDAEQLIDSLNTTSGYTDWRMPTVSELTTTFDGSLQPWDHTSGQYGPFVMPKNTGYENPDVPGVNVNDAVYWSATVSPKSTIGAKMVARYKQGLANDGDVSLHSFGNIAYVRPVRNAASGGAADNFTDNGDDTVSAALTGLMWQKITATATGGQLFVWGDSSCVDGGANAQANALCYCENLELDGFKDWRLPNRNELHSLVDYLAYDSGRSILLVRPFPDDDRDETGKTPYYWTSTTGSHWNGSGYEYTSAVTIRFDRGFSLADITKSATNYVRCVRDEYVKKNFPWALFLPAMIPQ